MTNIKSAVFFTGMLSLPAVVAIANRSSAVSSAGFNGGQMAAYRQPGAEQAEYRAGAQQGK